MKSGGVMMIVLYWLIGFLATTVGALAGLGGGVIIKPVLDAFGTYDIATIGILSSATVFSMSVVSLGRSMRKGVKLDGKRTMMIAFGSIIGGTAGKLLLKRFIELCGYTVSPKMIQSLILAGLMIMVFVLINRKDKIKTFHITDLRASMLVGFVLGVVSSFLGIGGGPLNVAILTLLFSMDTKDAAIHSIFIIFFAQISGLINVYMSTGFQIYNLEMLGFMIVGGITGGYLGSMLSNRMQAEHIQKLFNVTMVGIIALNFYNAAQFITL